MVIGGVGGVIYSKGGARQLGAVSARLECLVASRLRMLREDSVT